MSDAGGTPRAASVGSLLEAHGIAFRTRFGGADAPRLFLAPGRVNLMGAHLDYNGGAVMPMAIDRGTFLALRPRTDGRVRLASTLEASGTEAELADLPPRTGTWVDYPLGVVRRLLEGGGAGPGFDLLVGGNLPIGAGLSSSASITVGTAFALDALWERGSPARTLIDAALWAEREFVGVHCGIMDPFAVLLSRAGHLLWIDCHDEEVEHVPLEEGRVTIAVADSGVRRELAQVAFNERVSQCARAYELLAPHAPEASCLAQVPPEVVEEHASLLPADVLARARHVVQEATRTREARDALREADLAGFGERMTRAHASLRDLYEVSVPELDTLVEAAVEWDGVLGARLTGAGFGGCIVAVLRSEAREGFAEHLGERYRARFGTTPLVEFYDGGSGPREL